MSLSKREFLQVMAAAGAAGMALGRHAQADAQTAGTAPGGLPRVIVAHEGLTLSP